VPAILIYNAGTSGLNNDGLTLSNFILFNFSNSAFQSSTIGTGNNYNFSGNSIYQSSTPPATVIGATMFRGISIQAGNNHSIIGNYIGGQEVNCGGNAYSRTGTGNPSFIAILLTVDNLISSSVQNNVIQNFNVTGTTTTFRGIQCTGNVNVQDNLIGSSSVFNSIVANGTSNASLLLISGNNIYNNIIANVTNLATGTTSILHGIISPGDYFYIQNNFVNNLTSLSTSSEQAPPSLTGIVINCIKQSNHINQ
jgi:hypothetical protein